MSPHDRLAQLTRIWEKWDHGDIVPSPEVILASLVETKTWTELAFAFIRTTKHEVPEGSIGREEDRHRLVAMLRAARVLRLIETANDYDFVLSEDGYRAMGIPLPARITDEKAAARAEAWAKTAAARRAEIRADRAAREGKYELICGCGHVELTDKTPESIAELNARTCPRCGEGWSPGADGTHESHEMKTAPRLPQEGGDPARLSAEAERSSTSEDVSTEGERPPNRYPELRTSFVPPTETCDAVCLSGPYAGVRCTLHLDHDFDQDDHEAWAEGEMLESWPRVPCPECKQFFGCTCCKTTGKHLLQPIKSDYFTEGALVCVRCKGPETVSER